MALSLDKALNQIYSSVQSDHAINWLIAEPKYSNLRTTDLVLYDKGGNFDQLKMRLKSKARFVGFILLRWLVVNPRRCRRRHLSKYVFGRFVGTQVKPEVKKALSSNLRSFVQLFDVRHLSMRADETMKGWTAKHLNCELMRLSQAPRPFYVHDMPALAVKKAVTAQICHDEQQQRQQQFEALQAKNVALKKQMQQMRQEIDQLRNAVNGKNELAKAVEVNRLEAGEDDERAEFCEACESAMPDDRSLRSRNPVGSPSQVYDYCMSEDGTYIKDIFLKIFKFYHTPVDLTVVMGGGGSSTVQSRGGSFILQLPAENHDMVVKANVFAPIRNGSYYYEFKVSQDAFFYRGLLTDHGDDRDYVEVGWCADHWNPHKMDYIGRDAHSWAMTSDYELYPEHKCAGDLSDLRAGPSELERSQANPMAFAYWRAGDVIGCGIHRHGNRFNIIYFVNGVSQGEAWSNCKCNGRLYPTARVSGNKRHQMVFGINDLQYLPDCFAPLYSEM